MFYQPGARLGHFEILDAIGAGEMGDVYRARDTCLSRDVALKVLAGPETPRGVPRRAFVLRLDQRAYPGGLDWLDRWLGQPASLARLHDRADAGDTPTGCAIKVKVAQANGDGSVAHVRSQQLPQLI